MILPVREDCIHSPVCKYDDAMCPMECSYYQNDKICSICDEPIYENVLHECYSLED